jgi:hypothetical protein
LPNRRSNECKTASVVPLPPPARSRAAPCDATIKEFKRDETGRAWLIPRNPADQQPIPADDAEILGKVVTVMRTLR